MPEPMSPADVPGEFMQAADSALQAAANEGDDRMLDLDDGLRIAFAAVLPRHEQRVRQGIAAELAKLTFPCLTHVDRRLFDSQCVGCQRHAALVGAGRVVLGDGSVR